MCAGNKVEKNHALRVASAARNRARAELLLVLQADDDHGFLHELFNKKS